MRRDDVADDKIRKIVQGWKRRNDVSGPSDLAYLKGATDEHRQVLNRIRELVAEDEKLGPRSAPVRPGSKRWNVRLELRAKLQQAIKLGMGNMAGVYQFLRLYGAIPVDQLGWRYFRDLANLEQLLCWNCGGAVRAREVARSVRLAEFDGMAGSGRVVHDTVPYCPRCEKKPSVYGAPLVVNIGDTSYD